MSIGVPCRPFVLVRAGQVADRQLHKPRSRLIWSQAALIRATLSLARAMNSAGTPRAARLSGWFSRINRFHVARISSPLVARRHAEYRVGVRLVGYRPPWDCAAHAIPGCLVQPEATMRPRQEFEFACRSPRHRRARSRTARRAHPPACHDCRRTPRRAARRRPRSLRRCPAPGRTAGRCRAPPRAECGTGA